MKKNINELAQKISKLSTSEINELSNVLMNKYSTHANIYQYRIGIMATSNDFTTYNLFLRDNGNQKLMVLKTIKNHLGIGLKKAKNIIDSAPCVILENTSIEKAETLKNALEEVGALIEIYNYEN